MNLASPTVLDPSRLEHSGLATLPRVPGIYKLDIAGAAPHLAYCTNLCRRLSRLLVEPNGAAGRVAGRIRQRLISISYWQTASKLEAGLLNLTLARECYPHDYLARLRLRMPWFVRFTDTAGFARLIAVNRTANGEPLQLGPFQNRDVAQAYIEAVLHLFQLRRCAETLNPGPDHPGCIFGEMNQCLRPCQCAVSMDEYRTEQRRVSEFLHTNGRAAISSITAARDRAIEQTHFEEAAYLHKQLEKMKAAASIRSEIIADAEHFNGVAVTRSSAQGSVRLWPMLKGYWLDPVDIGVSTDDTPVRSLDAEIRSRLSAAVLQPPGGGDRTESLAVFARWYYSSWRDGEWFPFRSLADVNYRRLVREISKLVKV